MATGPEPLERLHQARQENRVHPFRELIDGIEAEIDDDLAGGWGDIEQSFLAGASGFVVKISAPEELVKAVRTVSRGALYLDSGLEETPAPALLANQAGEESLHKKLTPRQREVLQLIAEGHPNREIARILQISVKTVETHRENLLKRLGVHSTAGLTRYAIRMGLIQLDQ